MDNRIIYLFLKYINDDCTAEELAEVFEILKNGGYSVEWEAALNADAEEFLKEMPQGHLSKEEIRALFARIEKDLPVFAKQQSGVRTLRKIIPLWSKYAAAIILILTFSDGLFIFLTKRPQQQVAQQQPEQISPVNKGVFLSLGNGQRMILKQKHQGPLTSVGSTRIDQSDSLLTYKSVNAAQTQQVMDTLMNNSGKKFTLTLSDGTLAFLDVASSISYPSSFSGKERKVRVTGQVYFKVMHRAKQLFKVISGDQEIEDIGTEFNVNNYADEPAIKTTLISGSVKIGNANATAKALLKPGEQAVSRYGKLTVVPDANIEEVTAWLQGKMIFHNETLESIMRKVARIYGVQVIWIDDMREQRFGGSVSSSKKLVTVLNYFRKAGNVDFIVEGKTVKVFKKKQK